MTVIREFLLMTDLGLSGLFGVSSKNQSANSSENGLSIATTASATGSSEVSESYSTASSASEKRRNSNASIPLTPPVSEVDDEVIWDEIPMQAEEKMRIIDKLKNMIEYLENHDTIDSKVKIKDYKNTIKEALGNGDNATFIQLLIKSNQLEKEIITGEEQYVTKVPESPVRQETAGQIAGAAAGQGNNSTRSSNPTVSESSPASNRSSNNSDDRLSAASTPPMLLLQSQEFW